jgi:monoamine oxidase
MSTRRRQFLLSTAAATLAVAGCRPAEHSPPAVGGFVGPDVARGHALRDATMGHGKSGTVTEPAVTRRVHTLIAGGGVAGLAAARALRLRGHDDFALLELEDQPGGNARAGELGGLPCPLGAHYLPVPGDHAPHVQHLLEELGVRQRVAGRWGYDERYLCHSPQERLYLHGHWQPGLLPVADVGEPTLAQYRRFAHLVRQAQTHSLFTVPIQKWPLPLDQKALDAIIFSSWLSQHGLNDPYLRWYLDYCCRDEYGAGPDTVSAWAGIHYFASRHGFHAPGDDSADAEAEPVLTWPEGNGWLTRRLAEPLGDRLHTGQVVLRIEPMRQGVSVLAFNTATGQLERWVARHCIVALPVLVAARVVVNASPSVGQMLAQAAQHTRYAPWVVTNWHLSEPLHDAGGAAPAWDNVVCPVPQADPAARSGLGYVDATHQRLSPAPGPTVLTHYRALGDDPTARNALLFQPWTHWRDLTLAELAAAHPDLARQTTQVSVARYGHAMAMPVPDMMSKIAIYRPLLKDLLLSSSSALSFAHSDWAGYSVFEEAFTLGHLAGSGRGV